MPTAPTPPWLARANRLAIIARLLSSTVHDVNNALQVISGSAELLQMAPGATELVLRRSQAIATQASRASGLLNDLSDFVRDIRVRPEKTGLRASASQAVARRTYALTKFGIAAVVEGDEVFVDASPRHVMQILLNLMVNAEKVLASAAHGRVTLTVTGGAETASLAVEDNGPGLPEGVVWHAAQLAPEGAVDDLGIGLHVSRWLAGEMGGTLEHRPVPGGGSRFVLTLPAMRG